MPQADGPSAIAAFVGWPSLVLPTGAWGGIDGHGRALGLAALAGASGEPVRAAANERRTVHAVFAGSLYNRRELQATLVGRHALGRADNADILVHLYEERGLRCVRALRGAFALALFDERRQRLLLARDQLGITPLFYALDGGALAAASQLPLLLGLPGLADAWDPAALDAFLTLGDVPAPATFYPAIRQLGPGELAVWEDGRIRVQQYWQLTFPERRMARGDLPGLFRTQILEALRLRQAGVVSALLLSGGLGAATLLALAASDRRPPGHAYTVAVPGGAGDEVRLAATLARQAGVGHAVLDEHFDWAAGVDALLARAGCPVGGPELPLVRAGAARAVADGFSVVLAGAGGEEVFGGALPARWAERVRRYRRLPHLARETAELWARLAPPRWTESLRRVIAHERLAPLELYARAISLVQPAERPGLYTPETLQVLGDARPWAALTELFAEAVSAGAVDTADAVHYVELALRLPARAAALATLDADVRLPLADHRLAHFAASAPCVDRGTADARQLLLRGAVAELLPAEVLGRPHMSAAPPAGAWTAGGLYELAEETLAPARVAGLGVFRPETVMRLRREHLAGERDHGGRLWAILLASRWLERRRLAVTPTFRAAG